MGGGGAGGVGLTNRILAISGSRFFSWVHVAESGYDYQ